MLMTAQVGAQGENEITSADLALLEFLGDWGTAKGEWIDPLLFDDEVFRDEAPVTDRSITEGSITEGHWEDLKMNQKKRQSPFNQKGGK